jgi:hypothetical protein
MSRMHINERFEFGFPHRRGALWGPFVLVVAVAISASCGKVVREGRSPVYMVIDSLGAAPGSNPEQFGGTLLSDVITNVTSPAPCSSDSPCPTYFNDLGQAKLRISPKNVGTPSSPSTLTTNNDVTVRQIHVTYRRADGRSTPGVDVPYAFDAAATGTIPAGGTLTLSFELVRNVAKEESPLVQLITSPTVITTLADVTFYGTDQAGNDLAVTGTIQIDFGNFGDQ